MQSAEYSAFVNAARAWSRTREQRHLLRMLRSPFCGVPNVLAGAYAALAAREGDVLQLLGRERIADAGARDRVLQFVARLRELDDDEQRICTAFAIAPPAYDGRPAQGAIALAEAVEPEEAAGVRTQHPRFSASQLNSFVECPRKWFYRYVCAAVEDKGSAASFYGTAFHAALEEFHGEFPQPAAADPAVLEAKLIACVNSAFTKQRSNFETAVEFELQVRRARRTARKYVDWIAAEAKRAPFTVIGCELTAELQIEGYDFIGYIDRLDRDDATGAVSVIDYKTGSIAVTASEYRDKVRSFRDFQLPFYYWARTEAGDRVSRLALVPLKDARADVRPVALEVIPVPREFAHAKAATGVIPVIELERARSKMVEICRELVEGNTRDFAVATDPDACTYCVYTMSCARRPYPVEQRFAR